MDYELMDGDVVEMADTAGAAVDDADEGAWLDANVNSVADMKVNKSNYHECIWILYDYTYDCG